MDDNIKSLEGSKKKDRFKRLHKDLHKSLYACDVDLCLVNFSPPGIVAFLDYKTKIDGITKTEILVYNILMKIAPIYIVQGDADIADFVITKYKGGNSKERTCKRDWVVRTYGWEEYEVWEKELRKSWAGGAST